MAQLTESDIESAALTWLENLGYQILFGPEIAPGMPAAERENYGQVVLERRLRQVLERLNPDVPPDALEEAFRKLTRPDSPSLVANNHAIHKYLVDGVPVEYQQEDMNRVPRVPGKLDASRDRERVLPKAGRSDSQR